jgi:hypothetical protein
MNEATVLLPHKTGFSIICAFYSLSIPSDRAVSPGQKTGGRLFFAVVARLGRGFSKKFPAGFQCVPFFSRFFSCRVLDVWFPFRTFVAR